MNPCTESLDAFRFGIACGFVLGVAFAYFVADYLRSKGK